MNCPRCKRRPWNLRAVVLNAALVASLHGQEHLERLAPVIGIMGRPVWGGDRVLGVL